jgi:hypothetical protein
VNEGDRTNERVSGRRATDLEHRGICGMKNDFMFFIPYVPLVVCPAAPDVIAEFCDKNNVNIELVHWDFDRQLVPQLTKAGISTQFVFGLPKSQALQFFNFAKGVIVNDCEQRKYFRILLTAGSLLPRSQISGSTSEVLNHSAIPVVSFAIQTATQVFYLRQPAGMYVDMTFCKQARADTEISKMMAAYNEDKKFNWQ